MIKNIAFKMVVLSLLVVCFPAFVFAEIIVLKSGVEIEAEIIERTDNYIKINFKGTPVTYNSYEIERIEPGRKPAAEGGLPSSEGLSVTDVANLMCSEEAREHGSMAVQYLQQGNFAKALEFFEKAIEVDSKCLPAYLGLGQCHLSLKQYEKAVELYKQGIKNVPEYSWGFHSPMALAYLLQGKHKKAINLCKESLRQFPDKGLTYYTLGSIYISLKDYTQARENLTKAVNLGMQQGDNLTIQAAQNLLEAIQGK